MDQSEAIEMWESAVKEAIFGSAKVQAAARQLRAMGISSIEWQAGIDISHVAPTTLIPEPPRGRFSGLLNRLRSLYYGRRARRLAPAPRATFTSDDAALLKAMRIDPGASEDQ